VTAVEVLKIAEAGPDYIRLQDGGRDVRINFSHDEMFSKEESAGFFRGLRSNRAAIPVDGPFFIAVDFWRDRCNGSFKVIPSNFTVASVERSQLSLLWPTSMVVMAYPPSRA
jgi:hypothetical protein